MKKKTTTVALCALLVVFSAFIFLQKTDGVTQKQKEASALDPYDGGLHSIYELNCEADEFDSHSGSTDISTLELDFRNSYFIENKQLTDSGYLWYPRIKRLSDGRYILFYQDGKYGPNVYFTRSDDGYSWDTPAPLFEKHLTYDNRYWRYYATCDAIELEDGSIVAAAIFHANRTNNADVPSRWLMSEKGIVTRRSEDGGDTWSETQVIYNGRCWEPSLLQLPDGTLQLYFTQSAPKDAMYNTDMGSHVSSGVGLITSKDGGKSWAPIVTEYPYVTSRIAQQYIYTNENGIKIMTDQMPVAILLHDQKTIVMAVESLTEYGSGHKTSIIRSHDFFATSLGEDETGPYDRDNMLLPGAAPYIVQFPSGEIVVSNFKKAYIGNELGTEFYTDRYFNLYPSQSNATWGCLFASDSHVLLATAADTTTDKMSNGIGISRLILNHRIDAKTAEITVDAYTSDWYDNTDALFVGSINQAQTSIRAAHDEENIYFLFEHLDYCITSDDRFVFSVGEEGSGTKLTVSANADGITEIKLQKNGKTTIVDKYACLTKIYGTKDVNSDSDEGVVIEFSIPHSCFLDVSELRVFMKMYGNDGGDTLAWDGFNGLKESDMTSWHIVRLSDETAQTAPPADITDTAATDTSSGTDTKGAEPGTSKDSDETDTDTKTVSSDGNLPFCVGITVVVCVMCVGCILIILRIKKG